MVQSAFDAFPVKYPDVKAVVFFHVSNDNTTTYKSLDWTFIEDEKVVSGIKHSVDAIEARYGAIMRR